MIFGQYNYTFIQAVTEADYTVAKELFIEYANSLDFSLCFQDFEKELANINRMYNYPTGGILLLKNTKTNEIIGCVAVREFEREVGELKRMYLKPSFRKLGLGEKLLDEAIALARQLNYRKLRLDTMKSMTAAIHLYRRKGFYGIDPYRFNPDKEALFFELKL